MDVNPASLAFLVYYPCTSPEPEDIRTSWKMVINSGPGLADSLSCPVQYQANGQKQDLADAKDNALPVTLLSGFLVSRPDRVE